MPLSNCLSWKCTHEASLALVNREAKRVCRSKGPRILELGNRSDLWAGLNVAGGNPIWAGDGPPMSVQVEGVKVTHHANDAKTHLGSWTRNQRWCIPQELASIDTHPDISKGMKQEQVLRLARWCLIQWKTKADDVGQLFV